MTLAIVDATYHAIDDMTDGISRSRYTMPIGNVPLIARVVRDLAAGGVSRARVVAGCGERAELEQALGAGGIEPFPVEVVEAPPTAPRRGVLTELSATLGDEPVVLASGDSLRSHLLGEMRERYRNGGVDLVLGAVESVDARTDTRPGRLSESPLIFGSRTRTHIVELLESDGDGVDLAQALLGADLRVAVCEARGDWSYDGSTAGLLAANRRVLDRLPGGPVAEEIAEGNELHGRISIGRGVTASGCVIHGPVAIADHVVLEDCHIGSFTAIGPRAILLGGEVDDAIVLTGAEIRHPGHRITASIIGEHARVQRTFELPRGVQMRLAPRSELRFS